MKKFAMVLASVMLLTSSAFGTTAGDVKMDDNIDLKDVITSLQITAGLMPNFYVCKQCDINGDGKIGLEEGVYDLQVVAELRGKATVWYKDADGDKYSDGTTMISLEKPPSGIYYEEKELFAISGDANDNDPNVHPDGTPKWTQFGVAPPGPATVNIITDTPELMEVECLLPGMNVYQKAQEGQVYDVLSVDGCGFTSEIGKPQLPVIRRYVAIPSDATVNIEVVDSEYTDITGYKVYPLQMPFADSLDADIPPFSEDKASYQTDEFYPSEIIKPDGPHIIRGVNVLIVNVHPVQYNPVQKTLRIYSKLRVRATFSGATRSVRDQRLESPAFDDMLDRLVVNKNLLSSGKETRAAYDAKNSLLIITHPDFLEAANRLKGWKVIKGIYTEVRTTNDTGKTASSIKSYISHAYKTWATPPTYVLLIGDAEFIPTNYVSKHPNGDKQGMIGTDLYYSTVDGADYFPDISLGRLSVDRAVEAEIQVSNIINYEMAVVADNNFYKKAAVAAYFQYESNGYTSRRFVQTAEDAAIFLSNSKYLGKYSVDRIYYVESNFTPTNWSASPDYDFGTSPAGSSGAALPSYLLKSSGFKWDGNSSDVNSAINDGRFLLIHRDHGYPKGWGDPAYDTGNVNSLLNYRKLPVVWSINCQTGWFDNETDDATTGTDSNAIHFSEAWQRSRPDQGAIGVIAATRNSFSGLNDRLVWGWLDAIWPSFLSSYSPSNIPFSNPVFEMGPVLNYGKYYLATTYGESIYRKTEFEIFHWFGDPTLQMWTGVPQGLGVNPSSLSVSAGATSMNVTVPGTTGAVICVSKNGAILSRKLSTSTTAATTLSWSSPLVKGDEIYIMISKHDFVPIVKKVTVP